VERKKNNRLKGGRIPTRMKVRDGRGIIILFILLA
jgi:hypothetical protein